MFAETYIFNFLSLYREAHAAAISVPLDTRGITTLLGGVMLAMPGEYVINTFIYLDI